MPTFNQQDELQRENEELKRQLALVPYEQCDFDAWLADRDTHIRAEARREALGAECDSCGEPFMVHREGDYALPEGTFCRLCTMSPDEVLKVQRVSVEKVRAEERERAAAICDDWRGANCAGHDDNPCCHSRTAAAIADRIRDDASEDG